jgi:hypothetical protein
MSEAITQLFNLNSEGRGQICFPGDFQYLNVGTVTKSTLTFPLITELGGQSYYRSSWPDFCSKHVYICVALSGLEILRQSYLPHPKPLKITYPVNNDEKQVSTFIQNTCVCGQVLIATNFLPFRQPLLPRYKRSAKLYSRYNNEQNIFYFHTGPFLLLCNADNIWVCDILLVFVLECGLYYVHVKFEVLTVTSTKMAVFWDVAPCSLVGIDRPFKGAYCLLYHSGKSDDGGSKLLWNVGQYLPDSHLRIISSLSISFKTWIWENVHLQQFRRILSPSALIWN